MPENPAKITKHSREFPIDAAQKPSNIYKKPLNLGDIYKNTRN